MTTPTVQSRQIAPLADESSLVDLFQTLWFHRRLLFPTAFFLIAVGFIVVFQMELRYTASSSMMISTPKTSQVYIEQIIDAGFDSNTAIATEIEVLRSRVLAGKLIEKFNLQSKEEFNPALRPSTLLSRITPSRWIPQGWWGNRKSKGSAVELSEEEKDRRKEEKDRRKMVAATNIFLAKLKIIPIRRSNVIQVSFESTNPTLAANIANALPEAYIIGQMEAKFEAFNTATEWLNEQLSDLKEKVESSENAVESYRELHGLTEVQGTRILSSHFSDINRQLIAAKATRSQIEMRLRHIKELQSEGGAGIEAAKEVMTSGVIQRLRKMEDTLTRETSEMSVKFGPKHNKMRGLRIQLSDVRKKISLEIERIVVGLENEVEVARSKEQSLGKSLKEMERQSAKQTKKSIRLHTLEREASANRVLFETFLNRFKEASYTAGIQESDARVISKAEIPRTASYPNIRKMLIMIIAGAFFVAIILVLLMKALKQGLFTPEQIENELGLSTIGVIPMVPDSNKAHDYILENPHSRFSEALNTLKTSLILSSPDEALKVLQITSSVPSEGKSTLALAFARILAKSGNKVILVDSDLRRGSLQKKLGVSVVSKGLTDLVMTSGGPIEEFVIKDEKSGAFIMPNGDAEFVNATDIFSSHRMQEIIDLLKKNFDYVILDTPPVLAVSDARIIGKLVDKTLLVVQWDKTPRKVVKAAIHQLIVGGADIAGCALNKVNLKRYGSFSHGDSGYYYHYGVSGDYYTN